MRPAFHKLGIFVMLFEMSMCLSARGAEIEVPTRPFLEFNFGAPKVCLDAQRGIALSSGVDKENRSGSNYKGSLLLWDIGRNELVREVPMPAAIFNLVIDRKHHRVAIAGGPGNRDRTEFFLIIYDYVSNEMLFEEHGTCYYGQEEHLGWTDSPEGLLSLKQRGTPGRIAEVARVLAFPQGAGHPQWQECPGHPADLTARSAARQRLYTQTEGMAAFDPVDEDGGLFVGKRGPQGLLVDGGSTRILGTIGPDNSRITSHAIAADGSALAVKTGPRTLLIWDFLSMTQHAVEGLPPEDGDRFLRFAFSKDGRHLFVALCARGTGLSNYDSPLRVFVWNVAPRTMREVLNLPPHDAISVTSLKDGRLLVNKAGRLSFYDILTRREQAVPSVWNDSQMAGLTASPNGRFLWRGYFPPGWPSVDMGIYDHPDAMGLELIATGTRQTLQRFPWKGSVAVTQTAGYDYSEDSDTFVMGSEIKIGSGGYTHNELHLFKPMGGGTGHVQMPLSDPDGPMLTWCGLLKAQGRWLVGAARSNGVLESFDPETGRALANARRDPLIEDWTGALDKSCAIPETGRVVLRRPDGGLRFLQLEPDGTWNAYADLVVAREDQWLLRLSTGCYWTTLSGPSLVRLRQGDSLVPLSHLDLSFNRPHEVAKVFGASSEVVGRLESLWKARLARHGLAVPPSAEPSALPSLDLEAPSFLRTDATWSPHISWRAPSQPVTALHILVNRVPLQGLSGLRVDPGSTTWTGEVRLASGLNDIEVFVRDAGGNDSVHWRRRVWMKPSDRKPDLYYLGIGICDYQDPRLRGLEYPAKDVQDVAARLTQSRERFGKVITTIVKDSEATRETITKAAQILKQSQPDDHVIVFFAGHGFLDSENRYFFGTRDVDPQHPERRGLSYPDLQGLFSGVPALQRIMLMDTCHAGETDASVTTPVLALNSLPRGVVVHPLKARAVGSASVPPPGDGHGTDLAHQLFADLRVDTGAQVICAAQAAEVAYEGGDTAHNGWFTYCLLKHLALNDGDTDGDGCTSVAEVAQAVADGVRALSGGTQNPVMRESNDAARVAFWPGEMERLTPRQMLESYLGFAAQAYESSSREKASMLFTPHARYFGREVNRSDIEQDIAQDEKKYWIQYSPANLRVEAGPNGCKVLNYDLLCTGNKEGMVPCRMVITPSRSSWLITSLEATGKGSFKQTAPPAQSLASMPTVAPPLLVAPRDPAAFLGFYLRSSAQDKTGAVAGLFTSKAAYFGKALSREAIKADAIEYGRKFDRVIQFSEPSTLSVRQLESGRVRLTYLLQFTATNSLRGETRKGIAPSEMILRPGNDGGWLIESLRYTDKVRIETLKR